MKFAQAVIFATVASATVVSAVPTKGHAAQAAQKHNKNGKKASLSSKVSRFGSSALRHAGGIESAAMAAANIFNFRQQIKAQKAQKAAASASASAAAAEASATQTPVARAIAEPAATTVQTTAPPATPHNKCSKKHQFISNGSPASSNGAVVAQKHHPREFDLQYLIARDLEESLDVRDFDFDELDARDLEVLEDLIARGRFTGIANVAKKGFTALRNAAKGKKWDTFMSLAGTGATIGSTVGVYKAQQKQQENQRRDFDDIIESLEARGFDLDELDARELEELEELIARGRFTGIANVAKKGFTVLRNAAKGKKWNTFLTAASIGGTIGSSVGVYKAQEKQQENQQRDFGDMIESLEARGFDLDELDARELEELEELIARGRFSGVIRVAKKGFNAVRKAVKGHKMDGLMAASTVASFIPSGKSKDQPQQRDLDSLDELEMRDFDFELNELD